jgi:hypothetical protein
MSSESKSSSIVPTQQQQRANQQHLLQQPQQQQPRIVGITGTTGGISTNYNHSESSTTASTLSNNISTARSKPNSATSTNILPFSAGTTGVPTVPTTISLSEKQTTPATGTSPQIPPSSSSSSFKRDQTQSQQYQQLQQNHQMRLAAMIAPQPATATSSSSLSTMITNSSSIPQNSMMMVPGGSGRNVLNFQQAQQPQAQQQQQLQLQNLIPPNQMKQQQQQTQQLNAQQSPLFTIEQLQQMQQQLFSATSNNSNSGLNINNNSHSVSAMNVVGSSLNSNTSSVDNNTSTSAVSQHQAQQQQQLQQHQQQQIQFQQVLFQQQQQMHQMQQHVSAQGNNTHKIATSTSIGVPAGNMFHPPANVGSSSTSTMTPSSTVSSMNQLSTTNNNNMGSGTGQSPYMVLTQLPVGTTPFATTFQKQQQQQRKDGNDAFTHGTSIGSFPSASMGNISFPNIPTTNTVVGNNSNSNAMTFQMMMLNAAAAQMQQQQLQQVRPDNTTSSSAINSLTSPNAIQQQQQQILFQQAQQQHLQQVLPVQSSSNNNNMGSVLQPLQQQMFAQGGSLSNSNAAISNQYNALSQLLNNAQSAAAAANNNSNNNSNRINAMNNTVSNANQGQNNQLYTLGSIVEPVANNRCLGTTSNSSDNNGVASGLSSTSGNDGNCGNNIMVNIGGLNTMNSAANNSLSNSNGIQGGPSLFNESWKTMWDDDLVSTGLINTSSNNSTSKTNQLPTSSIPGNIDNNSTLSNNNINNGAGASFYPITGTGTTAYNNVFSFNSNSTVMNSSTDGSSGGNNKRNATSAFSSDSHIVSNGLRDDGGQGQANDNNNTGSNKSTTGSKGQDDNAEDWAPTPLSEIRAKSLRRNVVAHQQQQPPINDNGTVNAPNQVGVTVSTLPAQTIVQSSSNFQQHQQQQILMSLNQQHQLQLLQQNNQALKDGAPKNLASGDGGTLSEQLRQFQLQMEQKKFNELSDNGSVSSHNTNSQQQQFAMNVSADRSAKYLKVPTTVLPPSVMTSVLPASSASTQSLGSSARSIGKTGLGTNKATASATLGNESPQSRTSVGTTSNQPNKKLRTGATKAVRPVTLSPNASAVTPTESPQEALERILSSRGYGSGDALRWKAEDTCYDFRPSPLQLASFGTELVKAVHNSDVARLDELLSAGLSPNPCNQFRDSVVDLVCKRANAAVFDVLVKHGCDLRVCDGFGRTPLHHCSWASHFSTEIAQKIIETDREQLLMEDKRGQTPLEYVRSDQAKKWIDFLEEHADRYFPHGGKLPVVVSLKANRKDGQYLVDPDRCLPVKLAGAVSAGSLSLQQLTGMTPEAKARYS